MVLFNLPGAWKTFYFLSSTRQWNTVFTAQLHSIAENEYFFDGPKKITTEGCVGCLESLQLKGHHSHGRHLHIY